MNSSRSQMGKCLFNLPPCSGHTATRLQVSSPGSRQHSMTSEQVVSGVTGTSVEEPSPITLTIICNNKSEFGERPIGLPPQIQKRPDWCTDEGLGGLKADRKIDCRSVAIFPTDLDLPGSATFLLRAHRDCSNCPPNWP
jgi:hypothetical protein